jgi:hypothetical protein
MPDVERVARSKRPAALPTTTRSDVPEYLEPKSIAAVREVAGLIAAAEWAPSAYRDIEGKYDVAKITLAIMHGAAVGLGPFAAVQSIAVIDGLPAIWGDGALALVEHSGLIEDRHEDYVLDDDEGLTAICTMRRRQRPTPIIGRFSIAMADQARLTHKEGPWQSYPRRMLMMRARSWALRDGFADVLRGLAIREEVEDYADSVPVPIRSAVLSPALPLAGPSGARPVRPRFVAPAPSRKAATDPAGREADAPPPPSAGQAAPLVVEGRASSVPPESPAAGVGAAAQAGVPAPRAAVTGANPDEAEPQESFSLADAEGEFIDITGADALRSAFEQLFFDPHLPPAQILGLWESNDDARGVITRVFGSAALDPAEARLRAASGQYEEEHSERRAATGPSDKVGSATRPPSRTRRQKSPNRSVLPQPELLLHIDPSWPQERVFQHYRARLETLQKESAKATTFVDFRGVNRAIEEQLRASLPQLIKEVDAIYAWAATHAA